MPSGSMEHDGPPTASPNNSRILCPVPTCPEASPTSKRYFKDFTSIKNHLNEHCTGHISGVVPIEFLSRYQYSQCSVCDKILHVRYHGTCPRCRPIARTREQVNSIRNHVHTAENNPESRRIPHNFQDVPPLPNLSTVHENFVPTIRNVPFALRRLWAQCLSKALAQAVWTNNLTSWTELQMMPKCILCCSPRGGKSHKSQRLA